MSKVSTLFQDGSHWINIGNSWVRGSAFHSGSYLDAQQLCHAFNSLTPEDLLTFIGQLNGFYAAVVSTGQQVVAVCDRVRSIPLFFVDDGERVIVGDSPRHFPKSDSPTAVEETIAHQLLLTGFVLGDRTLCSGVKQIRAGEALRISGPADISRHQYYIYQPTSPYTETSDIEFTKQLAEVVSKCFQRLIKVASGRQILVPLSAGYDSKLIVLKLKELGYPRIAAYSYGLPGNAEAVASKALAESLDVPWHFIPYSTKQWHQWYRSVDRQEYFSYADGRSSVPHIQDWPAVMMLREKFDLGDAVFVPGHSADLLAGSRQKFVPEAYSGAPLDLDTLTDLIFRYHIELLGGFAVSRLPEVSVESIRISIRESLEIMGLDSDPGIKFESWDIIERQAKFIINSVRAYEHYGGSWWLPFWDAEFMDFWANTPSPRKAGKTLYINYIKQLHSSIGGCIGSDNRRHKRAIMLPRFLDRIKPAIKKHVEYHRNPMGWFGILSKDDFKKRYSGNEHINRFIASDMLKEVNL